MRLPFRDRPLDDAAIKAEGKMTGDEIRNTLINRIGVEINAALIHRKERNIRGWNDHPFDLVLGDPVSIEMCGIEIKGDTDNFNRLPNQLSAYQFAFPEVYLALHKKVVPTWVPNWVGGIRISAHGAIFTERLPEIRDPLKISTEFEWDLIFRANGLGQSYRKVRDNLAVLAQIRRNIIFNRFFAVQSRETIGKSVSGSCYETFYPLTDIQKQIAMGWDVQFHYKNIAKDIKTLEGRLKNLREIIALGGAEEHKQLPLFKDVDGS